MTEHAIRLGEICSAWRRLEAEGVGINLDWDGYLYRVRIVREGGIDWEIRRADAADALNELASRLQYERDYEAMKQAAIGLVGEP